MTDLWLVRHGQTDWNVSGRLQGQAGQAPGLNAVGRAQALALRVQLENIRFSAVYSSDLLRSRETAHLIAAPLGLTITLEPRLREMHLGAWEGMFSIDVEERYPQQLAERMHNPLNANAPQGESLLEVAERVVAATTEIAKKHTSETVLLVGHGVSLAVIICYAQGITLDQVYRKIPDNAVLNHVRWD